MTQSLIFMPLKIFKIVIYTQEFAGSCKIQFSYIRYGWKKLLSVNSGKEL